MLELGSPERRLALALLLAAISHALVLGLKLALPDQMFPKDKTLTVSLTKDLEKSKEDIEPELPSSDVAAPETQQTAVEPIMPTLENLITKKQSSNNEPAEVKITTSIQTDDFRRWVQSETDNFKSDKPEAVSNFDETFNQALTPPNSTPELSPYSKGGAVPRGRTVFARELGGKRTCLAKILDLLDISGQPYLVAKDCTPEKKFGLDLNKPNNAWTNR